MILVIGNYNYSSWSLRAWLALKAFGVAFETIRVPLYVPGAKEKLLAHSPAGKVPILKDGDTVVWDSLAILEYLAEKIPRVWPAEARERARARSLSAEMHAGFPNLRNHMTMNVRRRYPGRGRTPQVLEEIRRVDEIWSQARGPFLFGPFSGADAMYAPVVLRFVTYDVQVSNRGYMDAMLGLPAMQEWIAAAQREAESIPHFDMYE